MRHSEPLRQHGDPQRPNSRLESLGLNSDLVLIGNQLAFVVVAGGSVVTSNFVPLSTSATVTLAPTTADPVESVTVPKMLPKTC